MCFNRRMGIYADKSFASAPSSMMAVSATSLQAHNVEAREKQTVETFTLVAVVLQLARNLITPEVCLLLIMMETDISREALAAIARNVRVRFQCLVDVRPVAFVATLVVLCPSILQ